MGEDELVSKMNYVRISCRRETMTIILVIMIFMILMMIIIVMQISFS